MPQDDLPVLIVGAGPSGLVTAISLARQGVRSMVIERHPSTSIFPRATGVSLRSMELFRSWGIDDAVRQGGWNVVARQATVSSLMSRDIVEAPLGFPTEEDSARVSPARAAVSPQDHLEPVLLAHYRSLGLGEVRFSTELVRFEQDGSGVTATLRDRATGATSEVRCRYLVGADGHRSTVREALGVPMMGPDDLGRYMSILFRADLRPVLGETVYGLYMLEGQGPPRVVVPSGVDGRFVLAIPLPPDMSEATIEAAFPPARCIELVREAAGVADLEVEILATNAFPFSAQVAARSVVDRVVLVGDAAHRMTPRGGRGMNTGIADANDLGWRLAWICRGIADPSLLDAWEMERGPIGRRNVELSMTPGGGGSADGLAEDLGSIVRSFAIVNDGTTATVEPGDAYVPDARPGARAPHAWLEADGVRCSTLDLFGRGLALLVRGSSGDWRSAARRVMGAAPGPPLAVHGIGRGLRDVDGAFAATYALEPGGAVLVRPDGTVAWRCRRPPVDRGEALATAVAVTLGRGTSADASVERGRTVAA